VPAFTVVPAGLAAAELSTPARVTLDGVGGARPGMSVVAVSAEWGVPLRPSYEVRPTCGTARINLPGIVGGGDLHAARAVRRRLLPQGGRHG
jgi:hypothetical protein